MEIAPSLSDLLWAIAKSLSTLWIIAIVIVVLLILFKCCQSSGYSLNLSWANQPIYEDEKPEFAASIAVTHLNLQGIIQLELSNMQRALQFSPIDKAVDVYVIGVSSIEKHLQNRYQLFELIEQAIDRKLANTDEFPYARIVEENRPSSSLIIYLHRRFGKRVVKVDSMSISNSKSNQSIECLGSSLRLHQTTFCFLFNVLHPILKQGISKQQQQQQQQQFETTTSGFFKDVWKQMRLGFKDLQVFDQFHNVIAFGDENCTNMWKKELDVNNNNNNTGGIENQKLLSSIFQSDNTKTFLYHTNQKAYSSSSEQQTTNTSQSGGSVNMSQQQPPDPHSVFAFNDATTPPVEPQVPQILTLKSSEHVYPPFLWFFSKRTHRFGSKALFSAPIISISLWDAQPKTVCEIDFENVSVKIEENSNLRSSSGGKFENGVSTSTNSNSILNPYVAFYAPFSQQDSRLRIPCTSVKTSTNTKDSNLSFTWKNQEIPSLKFSNTNERAFRFIIIAIFDYQDEISDQLIGQAIVQLENVNNNENDSEKNVNSVEKNKEKQDHFLSFSLPLLKNCDIQTNMTLTGTVKVKKTNTEQRTQFVQFNT